jgi:putative spermidine/putrescine transport system ATP-binding protein
MTLVDEIRTRKGNLQRTGRRQPRTGDLVLRALHKAYGGVEAPAVDDVSLTVSKGEMLVLLGPSGCGKTTTLRMISGLVEPTGGSIEIGGHNVTAIPIHKRGMGMVFQSYALFPHLTIGENVAFGLRTRGVRRDDRERRVAEALGLVGLGHVADRKPAQLSGGQQQRIALARALVIEPSVLLLDEPLSNLDATLREELRDEIRSLQTRLGITTVFVTHDQDEAMAVADKVAVMNAGRVEQFGAPEQIYDRPASEFVARFIGRANLLDGVVIGASGSRVRVSVDGLGTINADSDEPTAIGQQVRVMVRPHRMRVQRASAVSAPGDTAHGVLTSSVYTGDSVSYRIEVSDLHLMAEERTAGTLPIQPGEAVSVRTDDSAAYVIPGSTAR